LGNSIDGRPVWRFFAVAAGGAASAAHPNPSSRGSLQVVASISSMSSNHGARVERAAKNEQTFQSYNARRADVEESGGTPGDEPVPFVCECDQPKCWRAIEIPLGEYERAVEAVDRFVVVPGHEDPAVEVVVEIRDNYLVVSKPNLRRRR
jgi:hypothetical protein